MKKFENWKPKERPWLQAMATSLTMTRCEFFVCKYILFVTTHQVTPACLLSSILWKSRHGAQERCHQQISRKMLIWPAFRCRNLHSLLTSQKRISHARCRSFNFEHRRFNNNTVHVCFWRSHLKGLFYISCINSISAVQLFTLCCQCCFANSSHRERRSCALCGGVLEQTRPCGLI